MKPRELVKPFQIADGSRFRLKDFDPADTMGVKSKEHAQKDLERGIARLAALQEKLYAQDRWAILIILQAMDAAGKDGTIKHVMSGVNPEGCQVYSFKAPSAEELQHDFLWRTSRCLPETGHIGIFNRSYYEEVLIVRVHPELLTAEKIPQELVSDDIWQKRFESINAFERYLGKWSRGAEVLSESIEEGAKEAVSGTAGNAGKKLEILDE
jgi:polyphosphate kinase 2 (PPK2 family)